MSNLITWYAMMVLLTLFVFVLGHGISGRLLGALIDERNRMSLSRLQLITWTIVILSAWITVGLWNLLTSRSDPLGIALPPQVWLLLGISTASLVGTPLILDPKTKTPSNPQEVHQQLQLLAEQRGISLDKDQQGNAPTDMATNGASAEVPQPEVVPGCVVSTGFPLRQQRHNLPVASLDWVFRFPIATCELFDAQMSFDSDALVHTSVYHRR